MFLALLTVAFATELRLTPSADATVEVLPSVSPGRFDVMVYRNHVDLQPQVEQGGPGIRTVRAMDMGGDWVVTVWLSEPYVSVAVIHEGDTYLLQAGETVLTDALASPLAPTLDMLRHGGGGEEVACEARPMSLTMLSGDDRIWGLGPAAFTPHLPVWSEAEPREVSWIAVEAERMTLRMARTRRARARSNYALGALHRDLGFSREAAYYFKLSANEHPADGGASSIQQAGALLRVQDWDGAETAVWRARDEGMTDEAVLEVLGVIALANHHLAPLAVGRALAGASPRAEVQLLAGILLSWHRCSAEAIAPLTVAAAHLSGERAQVAGILLSDAQALVGNTADARSTLSRIAIQDLRPEWQGLYRSRNRIFPLMEQTVDQWPAAIPGLEKSGEAYTAEGAESLWILGQIFEHLGDSRSAVVAYGTLLDRARGLSTGTPGRRLTSVWNDRIRQLFNGSRPFEALSLHAASWRPWMVDLLPDGQTLHGVAEAYVNAGLTERGLETYQSVALAEARVGADTRPTVIEVGRLYAETGRPLDALDTVKWLRTNPDPASAGKVAAVEATALESLGRFREADIAWTAAAMDPAITPIAKSHRALLLVQNTEEGGCSVAIGALEDAAVAVAGMVPPVSAAGLPLDLPSDPYGLIPVAAVPISPVVMKEIEVQSSVLATALSRCRTAMGLVSPPVAETLNLEARMAVPAAAPAAAAPPAPGAPGDVPPGGAPVSPKPVAVDPIWAAIATDNAADVDFRARLQKTLKPR